MVIKAQEDGRGTIFFGKGIKHQIEDGFMVQTLLGAAAILKGYLASGASPKDIYVMEADGEKLKNLERELGIIPAYSINLTAATIE